MTTSVRGWKGNRYQSGSTPLSTIQPPTTARLPIVSTTRARASAVTTMLEARTACSRQRGAAHAILIRRFRRGHIAADILPQHGRLSVAVLFAGCYNATTVNTLWTEGRAGVDCASNHCDPAPCAAHRTTAVPRRVKRIGPLRSPRCVKRIRPLRSRAVRCASCAGHRLTITREDASCQRIPSPPPTSTL